MNIGFYIPQLFGGGAERVVTSLANTLSRLGHSVSIVTTVRHENDYQVDCGVKRFVLNEMDLCRFDFLNKYVRLKRLREICKEERLEVLVAFLGSAIYSVLACVGLKTKVVVSERNSPEFIYKSKLSRFCAKSVFSLSDGAVFQTDDAQKWYPKIVQRKSVVIPNPVKDLFYLTPYVPRINEVVSIGRLTEQKNYPLLIDAFASVVKSIPDAHLHIYGEGHQEDFLQSLICQKGLCNNIKLHGRIDNVAEILSEASVFVMSSDVEGMPNALMEAMTVGVPSISTDCPCGGPRFLLSEGRGMLVPVGDVVELSEKILVLLGDKKLCEEYSLKSKTYMKGFQQEIITTKWLDFIYSVL